LKQGHDRTEDSKKAFEQIRREECKRAGFEPLHAMLSDFLAATEDL